jgi:hypothetical protein
MQLQQKRNTQGTASKEKLNLTPKKSPKRGALN